MSQQFTHHPEPFSALRQGAGVALRGLSGAVRVEQDWYVTASRDQGQWRKPGASWAGEYMPLDWSIAID